MLYYNHALMTGDTGPWGHFEHSESMKLDDKWLELFGGEYADHRPDLKCGIAPFPVSAQCCHWMKTTPAREWQEAHNAWPFLGLMQAEGGQRRFSLRRHGCNYVGKSVARSCPFNYFSRQDVGQAAREPLRTVTAGGGEFAAVHTKVVRYAAGVDLQHWPEIRALLNQYCGYELADDEVLLLSIGGHWYYIADIGLRMLSPRELYNAMGFPEDYRIDTDYLGNPYPKTEQVARCGNAVCPPMAAAVVRANWQETAVWDITTMAELERRVAV